MALCAAAVLLLPAGAGAQLIPGLPPILQPPGGPSQPVDSAPGEATAYGANPSRDGRSTESEIFGPLHQAWTRNFQSYVTQPLLVGDMVLVTGVDNSRPSGIHAFRASDGKPVWKRETFLQDTIAVSDGAVFVVSRGGYGGNVAAYALADGAPLWSRQIDELEDAGPPVAAGGSVYVAGQEYVYALSTRDGSTLFRRLLPTSNGALASLALDNERAFLADACGGVIAFRRANGSIAWDQADDCYSGGSARVYGGRVYSGAGGVYDAVSGARAAAEFADVGAFSGDLGFASASGSASAIDLASGSTAWQRSTNVAAEAAPLVVGPTVYFAGDGRLSGFAASSGTLLSQTSVRPTHGGTDSDQPGLAAGAGRLLMSLNGRLTAYRSVLTPAPDGIASASSGFDVVAGKRIVMVGGVGSKLRASRPGITLVANPAVGKTRRTRDRQSLEDGTSYFRERVRSNTRFTFRIAGAKGKRARDSFTTFAYAKLSIPYAKAVSRTTAMVKGVVKKAKPRALAGKRMVAYYGPRKGRSRTRLGSARLRTAGKGAAAGTVRFRVPRKLGRSDVLTFCVKNLPQIGYGRNVGFAKKCGKRKVKLPRDKIAATEAQPAAAISR